MGVENVIAAHDCAGNACEALTLAWERIAELEREVQFYKNTAYNARAEERERVAVRIVDRYAGNRIDARDIADFVRAMEDE